MAPAAGVWVYPFALPGSREPSREINEIEQLVELDERYRQAVELDTRIKQAHREGDIATYIAILDEADRFMKNEAETGT